MNEITLLQKYKNKFANTRVYVFIFLIMSGISSIVGFWDEISKLELPDFLFQEKLVLLVQEGDSGKLTEGDQKIYYERPFISPPSLKTWHINRDEESGYISFGKYIVLSQEADGFTVRVSRNFKVGYVAKGLVKEI